MALIDVLADGSRLALARRLREAPDSSAPQLADATGLHLNTVRAHLDALEEAGAVERVAESRGRRGRPVVRYRLRRDLEPPDDSLLPLTILVAAALAESKPRATRLRAAGAEWGRRWAGGRPGETPDERLCHGVEELGFNASVRGRRLRLSGCPCSLVAPGRPEVICGLAEGAIEGLLDGSTTAVAGHEHHPAARRCSTLLESR